MAFGILVPPPGMKPGPLAVRAWSPNHWTVREVPSHFLVLFFKAEITSFSFYKYYNVTFKVPSLSFL